ncbi:MAG: TetR/AcrR family transcriptional regulator [Candidatus Dormiibacterota bacterium]
MKNERQLAPWLVGASIEAVGKVSVRHPGRGRVKQHRLHRLERREQLLQACLVAFARDGLEVTTMDSIAATAGVSKPLVYRHFHNRREALTAVVEQESERLLEFLDLDGAMLLTPSFEQLTIAFLRFAADYPASFRLLFQLVDAAAGSAKLRVDQLRERIGRVMVTSLLSEAETVELANTLQPSPDAGWLAGMVSSIVEGVAGGLIRGEDPTLRAGALRQLLRPEGLIAALVEFRQAGPASGSADRERV